MLHFNRYVQDGEQFVREVAAETSAPWDMIRAFRILRAVLHALRNRLPVATSLHSEAKTMRNLGDFIEAVREEGGPGLIRDFITDNDVLRDVRAVLQVVKRHVSEGEMEDVLATLPATLRTLLAAPERHYQISGFTN
jgi:uncharacterized protein (DUF2267 family)